MQETNWIDLSKYGIQIILTKLPNQKKFLIAWGADEDAGEKLKGIGFVQRPNDPTVFFASRDKLGSKFMAKLLEYFPEGKIVPTKVSDIVVPNLEAWAKSKRAQESENVNGDEMKKDFTSLRVELSQDLLVGTNARGEKVYKTPEGRVCIGADGSQKMMNFKSDKSLFLLAGNQQDLQRRSYSSISILKAVEPFAKEIAAGKIYHFDDLKRVVETIFDLNGSFDDFGEGLSDAGAEILLTVESALRISIEQFALEANVDEKTEMADAIDSLFERTPKTPASYFNKSTTILNTTPAQADLIKSIVVGRNAKSVSITASMPGYLEAIMPKTAKVTSLTQNQGINPAATDILNAGSSPNVKFIDRFTQDTLDTDNKQDFVFINEPPASMAPKTYDAVTYSRKDLYRAAYNLMAMGDDGAALIAIQEPSVQNGELDGEFKNFMEWLYPRFGVKGAVEVNGALYGRSGEENNVRLIYVEGRNIIPELDVTPPSSLVVLDDHASVRGLSNIWLNESANEIVSEEQASQKEGTRLSELLATSNEEVKLKSNKFQSPYIHTSKVQSGDAMVNKDLELSTRKAHARLVRNIGDIDGYVAEKLQMTEDQLHRCFLGGQVCAIAQMIYNIENGKGFLLGDAPGQGKGRQIAAIIRYRILNGETALFITENSDLFRDIMRDMEDIESAHLVKPYVVDNGKAASLMNGTVIDTGSTQRNQAMLDGHIDPSQFNVVFSTYTQLRPVRELVKKGNGARSKYQYKDSSQFATIELFNNATNQIAVIADEVHNAASVQGNTNNVMERILDMDKTAIMSTGTSSRHIKNLSFYHRLIDIVADRDEFKDILRRGGVHVTTAFVQMLTEAGMYVRREEDLSKAIYQEIKDVTPVDKTRELVNGAANVFSLLSKLTGASQKHIFNNDNEDQLASTLGKFGGRLGSRSALSMGSTHFSSRFNNLQNMFNSALALPTIVEGIKRSVTGNDKPVVTFNNTGASFSERYYDKMTAIAEAAKAGRSVNPILGRNLPQEIDGEWVFPSLPSMKDVFYFAVEDVMRFKIEVNNGRSAAYVELGDLCSNDEGVKAIQNAKTAIMKAINDMPDLPFAPVDQIHEACKNLGLHSQEVTGRKKGFISHPSGGWVYSNLDKMNKNEIIDGFNNGAVDAVLLNVAGATGFSFHASPKFADQRTREMLFLEHMPDVLKARQVENRINRLGQVTPPKYTNPDLNFAVSKLLLAVQNAKREQFSACVTGSSETDSKLQTYADLINKTGDRVCMLYLEENPDVMERMGFDLDGFVVDGKYQFDGFATRFKDALSRLDYDSQHEVLNEVVAAYNAEVEYLKTSGRDLNNKSDFNINATKIREEVIYGEENDFRENAWLAPLKVREIEYKEKSGFSLDELKKRIDFGRQYLTEELQKRVGEDGSYQELVDSVSNYLDENRKVFVDKMENPDMATIKKYDEKVNAVKSVLPKISIGQIVTVKDKWDKTNPLKEGIITSYDIWTKNPLDWSITVTLPGGVKDFIRVRDIALDAITSKENPDKKDEPLVNFSGQELTPTHPIVRELESGKFGRKVTRVVLVGNMIEAIKTATQMKAGSAATYTDDSGARHACIMMPKGMSYRDVIYRPQPVSTSDKLLKYMAHCFNKQGFVGSSKGIEQLTMSSSATGYSPTQDVKLTVNKSGDSITLVYPKNKKFGEQFKTPEFSSAAGKGAQYEPKKSYNVMTSSISQLEDVIQFLYEKTNFQLFSDGDMCNFEHKLDSGEVVVTHKDINIAFADTSLMDHSNIPHMTM